MLNVAMYIPKNFYLFESLSDSISGLHSAGIVKKIIDEFVDLRYWNVEQETEGLKPLSMVHLEGTFKIFMFMSLASFVIFLFEKISIAARKNILKNVDTRFL